MSARWLCPPRIFLPLIALLALSAPREVVASTAIQMNSLDLQLRSDAIVVGRVVGLNSHWVERGLIVTDVKLQVERVAKGAALPGIITVRQYGGRVGDVLQVADDVPLFQQNEESLLFLKENHPGGFYAVVGLEQGKVNLVPEAGGRLRLQREFGGTAVAGLPQTLRPGTRWDYLDEFLNNLEVESR